MIMETDYFLGSWSYFQYFSTCPNNVHDITRFSPAYQVKITPQGFAFHSKLSSLSKHLLNYCLFFLCWWLIGDNTEVIGLGNWSH